MNTWAPNFNFVIKGIGAFDALEGCSTSGAADMSEPDKPAGVPSGGVPPLHQPALAQPQRHAPAFGLAAAKRRPVTRWRLNSNALQVLEAAFQRTNFPTVNEKDKLAADLNVRCARSRLHSALPTAKRERAHMRGKGAQGRMCLAAAARSSRVACAARARLTPCFVSF